MVLSRLRSRTALIWMALGVVYVVWGSTYLAIRVAVETLPPFLLAAVRFLLAGALLFGWCVARTRARRPSLAQWRGALGVGGLLLGANGLVVWAEQYVSSGLAALLVASVPLWMALLGRVALGERLPPSAVVGLVLGLVGVAALVDFGPGARGAAAGTIALLVAALAWAAGSLYSRRATLPRDPLLATAMEMLAGGALLAVVALARGELAQLDLAHVAPASVVALAYLVVFGSLLGFTAYVWVLREAPTSLVSTYAYVNPVVAVLLGSVVLGEAVTARMGIGGAVILVAVALIIRAQGRTARPVPAPVAAVIDAEVLGEDDACTVPG